VYLFCTESPGLHRPGNNIKNLPKLEFIFENDKIKQAPRPNGLSLGVLAIERSIECNQAAI
jgi:hypothetical protein